MSAGYHLWLENEAKGPYTMGQLRSMWNTGQITAENHYTDDAGENWRPLSCILSLLEPPESLPSPPSIGNKDNPEYQFQLQEYIHRRWILLTEGPSGAQLQAPKAMSGATITCLILGTLLLLAYGSGLILIIGAFVGHAISKPPTKFISRNCTENDRPPFMRSAKVRPKRKKTKTEQTISLVVAVVFIIGATIFFFIEYSKIR